MIDSSSQNFSKTTAPAPTTRCRGRGPRAVGASGNGSFRSRTTIRKKRKRTTTEVKENKMYLIGFCALIAIIIVAQTISEGLLPKSQLDDAYYTTDFTTETTISKQIEADPATAISKEEEDHTLLITISKKNVTDPATMLTISKKNETDPATMVTKEDDYDYDYAEDDSGDIEVASDCLRYEGGSIHHKMNDSDDDIEWKSKTDNLEIIGQRSRRFPSVEERLKVYLSNWYVPPCHGYDDGLIHFRFNHSGDSNGRTRLAIREADDLINNTVLQLESILEADKAFYLDRKNMIDCSRSNSMDRMVKNMKLYCDDVVSSLMLASDRVNWDLDENDRIPTILQFGDLKHSHVYRYLNIPHIKKFRSAVTNRMDLDRVTSKECYSGPRDRLQTVHSVDIFQPIVWKLATSRHYKHLDTVYQVDTPWGEKKDMAVFRGQLTGAHGIYNISLSDEANCLNLVRCRLVYAHANSCLVTARLTSTRHKVPDVLNGVNLVGKRVDIGKILQFKGIIMLEGNDVSSGLKWALLSQSVVLMPPPKHTSWALEELLIPWVHYIPLNENATNVEERMQWVLDHDEKAQQIAERGSLWIEDLVYHRDAAEDDRVIQEEILRRYRKHFLQDHQ